MKNRVTIIGTSLSPESRSQILARKVQQLLNEKTIETHLIDLRQLNLPICGTSESWEHKDVALVKEELERSTHFIFAVPIYNYDVSASAKNLVELTGDALEGKTVGFVCSAGGNNSYMSVMGFANSLMLDFRCWIVPRFVYATKKDFDGDNISNPKIIERLSLFADELLQ
jgi:FMN reductase